LALEAPDVDLGVLPTNCSPVESLAAMWLERGERQGRWFRDHRFVEVEEGASLAHGLIVSVNGDGTLV
jgi:hypothetical protein